MSDLVAYYMSAPPVARTIATAVFVSSVGIYTGLLPSYHFFFHPSLFFKLLPEVHRVVTSFLLTGPQMAVLFDTYFVFKYLSQLETGSRFSRKEDMIWYLMVVGSVIIFLNTVLTGAMVYLQALLIALCYTANSDLRGATAHFYIITIPAQMMPYCLLLVQLLFPNGFENLKVGLTGLVAAHLHDFLTRIYPEFGNGPNLIPTPAFMSYIMSTPRIENTGFGTAFRPKSNAAGSGSGPLPDSWRSKGPGRRLG
ncbi:centromere/microtubule-binding protein cbf5 [Microdochium trichocladiopsis]|uniref:Derlin n=1 Tax=Microdochium trichocladiopsis TaxID=1682393 RepID=A0A9P8YA57_9PEZI|nr:centromere/microtubule-binding protein cbf5 [Microdochium trichocladiopsis]KAH7033501.1 centromere/microtubule-binding protein cbf5 [Microdochium trichocladiopsis]